MHQACYATTIVADMRHDISNYHAYFNIVMIPVMRRHRYHATAIKQTAFERGREVGNPLVLLSLAGSPSDDDNVLCDVDYLSMKTR